MTEVERAILSEYHKQLKLVKIWRAIARRHLSCIGALTVEVNALSPWSCNDGETDP
jgi:hypothetical protein